MSARTRLAADIGGTFTDVAAFDEANGQLLLGKTLSTPSRLVDGISHGVDKAGARFADAGLFLHGSTIAINTMLERTGARTALLITEGFRDTYEIGRINRPDSYNLFFRKHVPLVERALRFEVRERMTATGEVLIALDEAQVNAPVRPAGGGESRRGRHPAPALLREPGARGAREAHRAAAAAARLRHRLARAVAGVPRVRALLDHGRERLHRSAREPLRRAASTSTSRGAGFRGAFLLVQSTGGLYQSRQAQTECVRMLESGPAAGVVGAQALCRELKLKDAVAFDMGGTTAKAGVIYGGEVLTASTALVGGYNEALPIQIPMVHISEVGTGGGSIAAVDAAGALRVGPQSAGADPGPACYALGGTRPTVTDANLVLGRLAADRFLGGEMKLDEAAARRAITEHVAKPLGLSLADAASGILRIAVSSMSYAVKGVSTERGLDAAAFCLIAYGGAGPLHASQIAREIGMSRIIVPRAPGHFCAFGMLHSDLRYDFVRTWFTRLEDAPFAEIERIYQRLTAQGRKALADSGVRFSRTTVAYAADMRYVGQEHPVTVDLSPVGVQEAQPRRDQAPLRRGAPAALRHQRPRGARRDRQPARHRDRPDEETAS